MKDRKTCSSMNLLTGALTWWSSLLGWIPTRVPCRSSIPLSLSLPPFSVSLQLSLLNKSHSLLFTAFTLTSYSPPCFLSCSSSASWLPNVGKEYAVGSVKQFKILLCVSPHLSLLLLFPVMLCYVFLRVFSASLVLSTTAFVLFFSFPYTPSLFPWFLSCSSLFSLPFGLLFSSSLFSFLSYVTLLLSSIFLFLVVFSLVSLLCAPSANSLQAVHFPPDLGHAEHSDDILQFLLSASCSLFFLPFLESIFLGIYFEITCNTRNWIINTFKYKRSDTRHHTDSDFSVTCIH